MTLRRVVDETLRRWPSVAAGYCRQYRRDIIVGDGKYGFGQGDWVAAVLPAAHGSPAWGLGAYQACGTGPDHLGDRR